MKELMLLTVSYTEWALKTFRRVESGAKDGLEPGITHQVADWIALDFDSSLHDELVHIRISIAASEKEEKSIYTLRQTVMLKLGFWLAWNRTQYVTS